jgi:hypothetical protein
MGCSNIKPDLPVTCGFIRPLSVDERRQLLEREKWINNVIRILEMPKWDAENLWVRIQVANHNESIMKGSSFS